MSPLYGDLEESLGAGGVAHIDQYDHPTIPNICLFLSNLPPDHCPGKFLLLNDRTYCFTAPFTALISSGAMPHWAIAPQKYQEGSMRYKPAMDIPPPSRDLPIGRCTVVAYPDERPMSLDVEMLKPIMFDPSARFLFGTQNNWHEWLARVEARARATKAREDSKPIPSTEIERILQKYSWNEGGVVHQPRRAVVEQTLFGPGGSDTAFEARTEFIMEYVFCMKRFPSNSRKATVTIIDRDGNKVTVAKEEPAGPVEGDEHVLAVAVSKPVGSETTATDTGTDRRASLRSAKRPRLY